MLFLKLFNQSQELFTLNFLNQIERDVRRSVLVIAPSPILADSARRKFQKNINQKIMDAVTLNHFVIENLSQLTGTDEIKKRVFKKSELISELGQVWKNVFPHSSYEEFKNTFVKFTEIRSYTISREVADEIFSKLQPTQSLACRAFWTHLEEQNILDEQAVYHWLSNEISELFLPCDVLIFYGFNYFNAGQIELFARLAKNHHVIVPIEKLLFDHRMSNDWISWIFNYQIIEPESELILDQPLVISKLDYDPRLISTQMEKFSNKSQADFIFASKNINESEITKINSKKTMSKFSVNIFEPEVNQAYRSLLNFVKMDVLAEKIIESLKNTLMNEIEEGKNFRLIKVLIIFLKYLDKSKLRTIEEFDLKIMREIALLDVPKVNFFPLNITDDYRGRFYTLQEIDSFNPDVPTMFILSENVDSLLKSEDMPAEEYFQMVCDLGPVYRSELYLYSLKQRIYEMNLQGKLIFCLDQKLLAEDPGWQFIFNNATFTNISLEENNETNDNISNQINSAHSVLPIHFTNPREQSDHIKKISATKLQDFINCPKMFFFKHVKYKIPIISVENDLHVTELGYLEHFCIQTYFMDLGLKIWSEKKCDEHIKKKMNEYVASKRKQLSPFNFQKHFYEVKTFASTGIQFICQVLSQNPKFKIVFEHRFLVEEDQKSFNGIVDCIIETDEVCILIDFKRSPSGIPTTSYFKEQKSIQLWFYQWGLKINKPVVFIYLCLSKIEKSLAAVDQLSNVNLDLPFSCHSIIDFNLAASNFETNLKANSIKMSLVEEQNFLPSPLDQNICQYCPLNLVCDRRV